MYFRGIFNQNVVCFLIFSWRDDHDSYFVFGDPDFKSLPGDWLSCRFSWLFSRVPGIFWDIILEEVTTASFHNFSTSAFFNLPTIRRCISCAPERIPLYNRSINHEASRIILSIAFFISYSDIFDTLFAVAFNLYTSLKLRFIFLMIS